MIIYSSTKKVFKKIVNENLFYDQRNNKSENAGI